MKFLVNMFNRYQSQILYLVFGVATTVVNIIVYGVLHAMNTPYQVSYWVAWFWAVFFAYLTNRVWVFHSKVVGFQNLVKEIIQFYIARVVTGIIGWAIMFFGVSLLHQNDFVWNIIQNVFVIVSNYFLSKFIIFRAKERIEHDSSSD
ncbi:GtrA family protein [Weissella diestrammenae]|uniref:GtrA family protein n=1 Tax=Weissella diestrammenae TaxID=1162633 RepID=A0A7G9T557_9LACO|nr:GtrA family protein [Weissella diestrammenae]MCM0583088.1 GtrA family protein [Weissella diestrammenae]QNN75232.1 GtrA family protein [Weissella diestrammenae]